MKNLWFVAAIATLIAACQGASSDKADLETLRQDVDALKLEVYGDPLAKCEPSKVFNDISAYEASIEGMPDAELEPDVWHTSNATRDNVVTTESGLQYTLVQDGTQGAPTPVGSQMVTVHYHGVFPDGSVFDSSYNRGETIDFPANGVIRGWVEALQTMKPCEARTLYVPGDLAYGASGRGQIPPNATLIFFVQLIEVQN